MLSHEEMRKASRRYTTLTQLEEQRRQKYDEAAEIEARIQKIREGDDDAYFYPETSR